jgi:hypothetical protein
MNGLKQIVTDLLNGSAEYCYYGVRAHHNMSTRVNEQVSHRSTDWQTERKLEGVCAIDVVGIVDNADTEYIDEICDDILAEVAPYLSEDGEIIVIAADDMEYGEDENEIIISGLRVA